MHGERWEHGSDYGYPELSPDAPHPAWLPAVASYWHSGRHALRALLESLRPGRVHFPSFYCQDVHDAAQAIGLEISVYADGPEDPSIDPVALGLRDGDVVVVTNTYGLRHASPLAGKLPLGVIVVEDHTHDPISSWARTSTAPYAFASLRKWFPLPDGGILWSPAGLPVVDAPQTTSDTMAAVTLDRLSGMLLKRSYLAGDSVSKESFRARSVAGELAIGHGAPAPMSEIARALLGTFPASAWAAIRAGNHHVFGKSLGTVAGIRQMSIAEGTGRTPFVIVLVADTAELRERVRAKLVAQKVYPAVLWPIDGVRFPGTPEAHVDLSRRILCLHCDHRYEAEEMVRVAEAVRTAVESS